MATYCIGDVQGCYAELEQLLKLINYDPLNDQLWLVGDLVNRGPNSLEVLRLVKRLPNTQVVLGNHDIHLLNFYNKIIDFDISHLEPILTAPDGDDLIDWLRHQPLIYYNQKYQCAMVHAGIYPGWDLTHAIAYAREAEELLRATNYVELLEKLYGDLPDCWDEKLGGIERIRFIVNSFTRMRFCSPQGKLEFETSGKITSAPPGYLPWFKVPGRKTQEVKILFGHWSALAGKTDEPNAIALDTGCVWGGSLTALCLDDGTKISYPREQNQGKAN